MTDMGELGLGPTPEAVEAYGTKRPGMLDHRRVGLLSWDELPMKPCQDQVLVLLDPPKETASGIHIPVSAQRRERTVEATVIAVGPRGNRHRGRARGLRQVWRPSTDGREARRSRPRFR